MLLNVGVPNLDTEDEFTAATMELEPFDRNSATLGGQTPLSVASEGGHEAVVKLLLAEHGVELDHKDSCGRTPLALASARGYQGVVKLLLDTNLVDPDSRDSKGRASLSLAAQNWQQTVVQQLLLEARVDPASEDTSGLTLLDWTKKRQRGGWNEPTDQIPVVQLLQAAIAKHRSNKSTAHTKLLPVAVLLVAICVLSKIYG